MIEADSIPANQRPLHALNRLAFGPRPGDLAHISRTGVERWIDQQLHPESFLEPPDLTRQIAAMRTLHMTPVELFVQYQIPVRQASKDDTDAKKMARQQARIVIQEAVRARIIRAVTGPRQLHEVMTAFWFNHFNVFAGKGPCHLWIGSFEQEAIRPHALGRFRDLLGATARHPAMLFYLDNWQNTAPNAPGSHGKFEGINENYARELMELHTLGVNGGYAQADVIALAHILTGWGLVRRENQMRPRFGGFGPFGFHPWRRGAARAQALPGTVRTSSGFFFDPSRHDSSDKILLGHQIKADGITEGEDALDLLARSPATANHLSYQLAQYFVADNPPPDLVERMAQRYLASDGNIREVLAALFASSAFWDRRCYGVKFKTPYEYVISAVRAAGSPVLNVRPLAATMARLGMPLYGCQTPDGYKNTQEAWLNPDAMMIRLSFATGLGVGRLPLDRPVDEFADEGGAMRLAALATGPVPRMEPPDPSQLAATLGDLFSPQTADAVKAAPAQLRAPLIIGSPEFMRR